jgi:glycosyltransferase involved in cell wall biosynthesis
MYNQPASRVGKSTSRTTLLFHDRQREKIMGPALSVIVPAYNEERHLEACLTSLFSQDFDLPYEVIVVDGPSEDGTAAVAGRFPVRLVRLEQRGIGAAWKAGAENSRADILAFTEADTVVPAHWLGAIHRVMMEHPQAVGMVGSFILAGKPPIVNALARISIHLTDRIHELYSGTVAFRGKNFAIRMQSLAECGGFDERVEAYGDVELSMRAKRLGKIIYLPSLLVQTSSREFEGIRRIAGFLVRAFTALYLVNAGRGKQVKISSLRAPGPGINRASRTDEAQI